MRINDILAKLARQESIRFRGEEQGRFRFKFNNDDYCGSVGSRKTSVTAGLNYAILYAIHRSDGRRYNEQIGQPIMCQRYGFPLVMAIDVSKYPRRPGAEPGEEVLSGKIEREDIVILFDENTDYLKQLIGETRAYIRLVNALQKAIEEAK